MSGAPRSGRIRSRVSARLAPRIVRAVAARPRLARGVVRAAGSPTMFELTRAAAPWTDDAGTFLAALFPDREAEVADAVAVAVGDCRGVVASAAGRDLPYPGHFGAEVRTLTVLHAVVRMIRPAVVLETGVANGCSSEVILRALGRNDHGALHSVDIGDDVGALVTDRDRWRLHVVDPDDPEAFPRVVAGLSNIGVFFHDADHRYPAQAAEYAAVWPRLPAGGVLLSDDVDASYAFLDLLAGLRRRGPMLLDHFKVTGAVVRD